MDRFYQDVEKLIESKSNDLYRDCCVQIIEQNGLKKKAIECALKICDMHIANDVKLGRCELTTMAPTLRSIKNKLYNLLNKESTNE